MKGLVKWDGQSAALAALGAAGGTAIAMGMTAQKKSQNMNSAIGAGVGLLVMLGLRAAMDPALRAERAT